MHMTLLPVCQPGTAMLPCYLLPCHLLRRMLPGDAHRVRDMRTELFMLLQVLARSRAVFTNGFLFDELPLPVVVNAIEYAASSGASIFFDPGRHTAAALGMAV